MTIVLDSKFTTAEDVAKVFRIPKSRVQRLKKLVEARTIASDRVIHNRVASKNGLKVSASAKRAKNARGRAKKIA